MITTHQIREKALRCWDSQQLLRAELKGVAMFPLVIRFRKPGAGELLEKFGEVKDWLSELRSHSKEQRGHGYTLTLKPLSHRKLGEQLVPDHICFDSPEDLCRFIGKDKELLQWRKLRVEIEKTHPALAPWIERTPLAILDYKEDWERIFLVISFFQKNLQYGRYLRQLEIPGIDTKFIERHKPLLWELLKIIIPQSANTAGMAKDQIVEKFSGSGFEQRYGLKYDEPAVRFRLLDPALNDGLGLKDMTVPVSDFKKAKIACSRVFVTENKINGLSFPICPKSIVVFGLGYGLGMLSDVDWLKEREIIYWGDIDTHGFAILSQIRSFLPQARSFLMDSDTFLRFRQLCVEEPEESRFTGKLSNLTQDESKFFDNLREGRLGFRPRLEQERIPFGYICEKLTALVGIS